MAATVTLTELRARVREVADMETGAQSSHFADNTELDRAINRALKQLVNELTIARGDDYYATSTTTTTVAGTATTGLPANFFQLLKVLVTDGSSWHTLDRWELEELAELRAMESAGGGASIFDYRYRVIGANIEIRPVPTTSSHTLHIYYLKVFPALVADADTVDGINGWEDWAVYTAGADLLNKEESFEQARELLRQRAVLDRQIKALAGSRDAGRPYTIQDVRGDWASCRRRGRRRR